MPLFTLSSLTCHRFVITSITVSSKALCDAFSTNTLYAKVGGIPVTELNMLEREFLRMIEWQLTVSISFPSYILRACPCVTSELNISFVVLGPLGQFFIGGPESSSSISSDSDMDGDGGTSRPTSPTITVVSRNREASTILIDTATLSPESPRPPTLEQNMAFADFQQSFRGG
ncbi:uncharacterized protein FIBRA_02090 [Fibroporia radiculosa]|uniref:Cyclin N-terminal domain-containing protein n=1 Tax=Fibroporia radiculosa TaxID=599839 RepID=J4G1C5_9APHY|nr:uncharacterized protein FIBRA_02090 [Fibroporia radiculosa]CCM00063.1 predicted protein [Fibroporia radiculosa]